MWFLLLWAIGLLTAGVYFLTIQLPSSLSEICNIILLNQFIFTFGLIGIIGFYINVIIADKTSKNLGWPGGPFQIKYGFSQLGVGIMGIMSIWFRGNFWIGTLVAMYIYGLSGLWSHTQHMIQNKKLDASNLMNIIMDIIYQTFITVLSILAGNIWHP